MAEAKKPLSDNDKLYAAVAYISLLSIVVFLLKRNNEYVAFHARQGIILFIASLVWWIPILGWVVVALAYIFMVIGFLKAYEGDWFKIPFVHQLSERFK